LFNFLFSFFLVKNVFPRFGIQTSLIDTSDIDSVSKHVIPGKTKVIYIETPGNPLGVITDIKKCAEIAHKNNAILIVDSTFSSPVFQRPLIEGADVVLHSVTKYLNGHGDVVGGISTAKEKMHADAV
jgi:methionine-gamma-lyase